MRWSVTKEDKESNSMKIFLFKKYNYIIFIFFYIIKNILFFSN